MPASACQTVSMISHPRPLLHPALLPVRQPAAHTRQAARSPNPSESAVIFLAAEGGYLFKRPRGVKAMSIEFELLRPMPHKTHACARSFGAGDTIGCGFDGSSSDLFFTCNCSWLRATPQSGPSKCGGQPVSSTPSLGSCRWTMTTRRGTWDRAGLDPVPLSKIGTHLLASLWSLENLLSSRSR